MREPFGLEVLYEGVRHQKKRVAYGNIRIFGWGKRGRVLTLPGYDFDLVLHKNPMPAGILYPRAAWAEVGGYPEAMIYGREDWAFNIALGAAGWCGIHVGMSGNLYRRERQNRSLRTGNVHRGENPPEGGFSWRRTFQEQLRRIYPALYAGERPVGCCGGRNSKKAAAARRAEVPTPRAIALATEADMVWLEYIGGNAGNSKWRGPATGTVYVFGGKKSIGQVHAEDAPGMLEFRVKRRPQFRAYAMAVRKREPVPVPRAKAEQANPPQPDDLTAIRGVGAATASKLKSAGFVTFLALAKAQVDQVAERAGIPMHIARKAVAGAKAHA
jgi:predicted flap endonuclease-1-like 5' DNA nuclease